MRPATLESVRKFDFDLRRRAAAQNTTYDSRRIRTYAQEKSHPNEVTFRVGIAAEAFAAWAIWRAGGTHILWFGTTGRGCPRNPCCLGLRFRCSGCTGHSSSSGSAWSWLVTPGSSLAIPGQRSAAIEEDPNRIDKRVHAVQVSTVEAAGPGDHELSAIARDRKQSTNGVGVIGQRCQILQRRWLPYSSLP